MLELRLATGPDQAFLRALHAARRAGEFTAVGLAPAALQALLAMQYEAQARAYALAYPEASRQLVLWQGRPVGALWWHAGPGQLRLLDIGLLPTRCGQGLGSACLRRLQQQACERGQVLLLQVAEDNPARRLYARLGFQVLRRQGLHLEMCWPPAAAASPPSPMTCQGAPSC